MAPTPTSEAPAILARARRRHGPTRAARIVEGADDLRFRWKAEDGRPLPRLNDDPAGFDRWAAAMAYATQVGFVRVVSAGLYEVGAYVD